MLVNEIFSSIEGEGIRTGFPVIFIRLYSCNLHCSYCDTRYSCENNEGLEMSIDEILENIKQYSIKKVTLTGGEPLIHKDVELLIDELINNEYEVNIETNGSIDIYPYITKNDTIITMDYKSISSGMNHLMLGKNLKYLRSNDVLKFVVGTEEDLLDMLSVIQLDKPTCNIFVSPVFGKIEMRKIVDFIKEYNLNTCRIQIQLHKIIWPPTMRGV